MGEQALRPDLQKRDHHREDRDLRDACLGGLLDERVQHPDPERREHRTVKVPQPADDHDEEGIDDVEGAE